MTDSWFTVNQLENGLFRIGEPGYSVDSYCYLLEGAEKIALIDTGHGFTNFHKLIEELSPLPTVVLLTHAHADHAGAAHQFQSVYAHQAAAGTLATGWPHATLEYDLTHFLANRTLPDKTDLERFEIPGISNIQIAVEGDVIDLGGRQLDVFETPGHTNGDLSFLDLEQRLLFTGDALYPGNIAISNTTSYRKSIEKLSKLARLADHIYGAHGTGPLNPQDIEKMRRAFYVAMGDRRPDHFLGGLVAYNFDGFGFLLPPKRQRRMG